MMTQKQRETRWAMYDWANSVYSLTITTAVFPPFYESISKALSKQQGLASAGRFPIKLFGVTLENTVFFSFALALASLVIAFLSPILSGIADSRGLKKRMMQIFCYVGSLSCAAMYFSSSANVEATLLLFVLAAIGFAGSLVFYNGFLPEITTPDRYDRVSAKGFSLGYVGSVILLIANLALITQVEKIFPIAHYAQDLVNQHLATNLSAALDEAKGHYTLLATQISFLSVGLWWAGFAQITFRSLPKEKVVSIERVNVLSQGFSRIARVLAEVLRDAHMRLYLLSFFFISMGVQTVMALATLFGSKELGMSTPMLILTVLVIQIVAIGGATLFSRLSERFGNFPVLIAIALMWISITFGAFFVQTSTQFMILAAYVGLIMGAVQSLLRSTYAKLIPKNTPNHASYFSLYDVTEKLAIVIGTATYGIIEQATGSMRNASLALGLFFVIGIVPLIALRKVKFEVESLAEPAL